MQPTQINYIDFILVGGNLENILFPPNTYNILYIIHNYTLYIIIHYTHYTLLYNVHCINCTLYIRSLTGDNGRASPAGRSPVYQIFYLGISLNKL
jgi:hypothetical protein